MRNNAKVGIRTAAEVNADPLATPTEIIMQLTELEQLAHPNCPVERWWELTEDHPFEAMESPLYPLLTLEEPSRWGTKAGTWIDKYADELPEPNRRLFAADCAERALHVWVNCVPKNNAFQKGIAAARNYAKRKITQEKMLHARDALDQLRGEASEVEEDAAAYAASAAMYAASLGLTNGYAHWAASEAVEALCYDATPEEWDAERLWQWGRLLHYMSKTYRVGAKTHKGMLANPTTDPEIVRRLAIKHPRQAIQHPNCPTDLWWKLAATFPIEAKASVLFPLLTLEAPERWLQLEQKKIWDWITFGCLSLPDAQLRLFTVDCAAHVLPRFEEIHPQDNRPRRAIEVAREMAKGKASARDNITARYDASTAAKEANRAKDYASAYAAESASWTLEELSHYSRNVMDCAVNAMMHAGEGGAAAQHRKIDAQRWIWEHLQTYLAKKEGIP